MFHATWLQPAFGRSRVVYNLTIMKVLNITLEIESDLWERRPRRDVGVAPKPIPLTFTVKSNRQLFLYQQ